MTSNFKKISSKIQKEWHTKKEADAIAASIGRKKYGAEWMAKKAVAWKKKKISFSL